MIDIMKNRRTIRKYTEQDIPEELLNELLEVAVRASNTGNIPIHFYVLNLITVFIPWHLSRVSKINYLSLA